MPPRDRDFDLEDGLNRSPEALEPLRRDWTEDDEFDLGEDDGWLYEDEDGDDGL
jgi:hypothetical protein